MQSFIHTLIRLSAVGGAAVLIAVLLRFVLRRAPKRAALLLWAIVALRLAVPVFISSPVAVLPGSVKTEPLIHVSAEDIPSANTQAPSGLPETSYSPQQAAFQTHAPAASAQATEAAPASAAKQKSAPSLEMILFFVWLAGFSAMLGYFVISCLSLRKRLASAELIEGNVFRSENAPTPFLFGLLRPRIYVPAGIDESDLEHVLEHERAHIKNGDHIWKALGFVLLSVHWFNPLVWLGYALFSRDLELACDERVIKRLPQLSRAEYCEALLKLSAGGRKPSVSPLAFGMSDVKARIRSIAGYKKPAVWLTAAALLLSAVFAACSFTAGRDASDTPQPTETAEAAPSPTAEPTGAPTEAPTAAPTAKPTATPVPTEAAIVFADAGFEECLREALGIKNGRAVTAKDLSEVTNLYLRGENIFDLSDAHKLPYLEALSLNGTTNANLSTLAYLRGLKTLYITNCGEIDDIGFVRKLSGLSKLTLDNVTAADYSPLTALKLTTLYVSRASAPDPSVISGMTSLEYLALSDCGLTDISFISGLTALKELTLSDNYISDISPLSGLDGLKCLVMENNFVTSIDVLFELGSLSTAELAFNPIETERIGELRKLLEKRGGGLSFYPTDANWLARWPIDLDGDGTDEYFCLILDWLMGDFVSFAWVENADHHLLGQKLQCGTGHVAFNTFAVVQSPEYGVCLMRLLPEFEGENYGYELMKVVNGRLQTVHSVGLYYYDGETDDYIDPDEAAEYEAEVNALLETGYLLVSTDRWGVMKGDFANKRTEKEFTLDYSDGEPGALISAYGSIGSGIAVHRAEMEADGFVFTDDPVFYRLKVSEEFMEG